jgi:hypothetical protein
MKLSRQLLRELLTDPKPKRSKRRKNPNKGWMALGWRRKKRFVYCSNRGVHPGGYRIFGKPYYWGGRPLCKNCYYFFTASRVKRMG